MGRLCVVVLALVMVSAVARAEGPPDVIELDDGSLLQGRITEWRPHAHVIVVLLDGEARTLEWATILRASGPTLAHTYRRPAEEARVVEPAKTEPLDELAPDATTPEQSPQEQSPKQKLEPTP